MHSGLRSPLLHVALIGSSSVSGIAAGGTTVPMRHSITRHRQADGPKTVRPGSGLVLASVTLSTPGALPRSRLPVSSGSGRFGLRATRSALPSEPYSWGHEVRSTRSRIRPMAGGSPRAVMTATCGSGTQSAALSWPRVTVTEGESWPWALPKRVAESSRGQRAGWCRAGTSLASVR